MKTPWGRRAFVALACFFCARVVGTSGWVRGGQEAVPLGLVRVTRYTHYEGGRLTASGHRLIDEDAGKVCAVGRDWFRKYVRVRDRIWIEGFSQPCQVLDTMALRNRKGLAQTRWIDVYSTDRQAALDFGIQKRRAYLLRGG